MRFLSFIILFVFIYCNPKKETNNNVYLPLIAANNSSSSYQWNLPKGFPQPVVPTDNPMTDAKVELGRRLFYDTKLSQNQTQSCGSCHIQELAFSDGKPLGVGSTGEVHPRSPQQLSNIAYQPRLTWINIGTKTLETQMRAPMFGVSPVELGLVGDDYLNRIKSDSLYLSLFQKAYNGGAETVTEENVRFAISCFQRSLISGNSYYDQYSNGNKKAMSASAIRGMQIFNGEVAECFHCHGGFNFTDTSLHNKTTTEEVFYHDNGNKSTTEYKALKENQKGLYEITGKESDIGRFRTPSLRNIAVTYPYMHDGSIDCSSENKGTAGKYNEACAREALKKVVEHYISGGKTPSNKDTTLIKPFSLTEQEKLDLVEFLMSLTDEEFLKNSKFKNPF